MLSLTIMLAKLDYFNPEICGNCMGRLDDPKHDFEKCKTEWNEVLARVESETARIGRGGKHGRRH